MCDFGEPSSYGQARAKTLTPAAKHTTREGRAVKGDGGQCQ